MTKFLVALVLVVFASAFSLFTHPASAAPAGCPEGFPDAWDGFPCDQLSERFIQYQICLESARQLPTESYVPVNDIIGLISFRPGFEREMAFQNCEILWNSGGNAAHVMYLQTELAKSNLGVANGWYMVGVGPTGARFAVQVGSSFAASLGLP